jgi:hypothetical protein
MVAHPRRLIDGPEESAPMARVRPSLALGSTLVVGMALWAAAQMDPTGASMAEAAQRFLTALDDDARARAAFAYDDPERLNWHFIPRDRKGLSIKEMTPEQRALAFGLIQSGTSRSGAVKVTTIMSLEAILRDLEKGSGPVRDPERYFVSIFGTPSNKGRWGWRVEGHHLSLNFTVDDGKISSATPAFFGANPAEVRQGPRQGLRTLAEIEDRALRLFQALDDAQQKTTLVSDKAPNDIPSNNGNNAGLAAEAPKLDDAGLPAADMTPSQRRLLDGLINAYAGDMPTEVASAWLADVERSGDDIRFAWYGPADRTQPHAYLVQGRTFLIEFNNTQNNANHIHSSYRSRLGDFGLTAAAK